MSSPLLASELPKFFAISADGGLAPNVLYVQGGRRADEKENYQEFFQIDSEYDVLRTNTHTRFYLEPAKEHGAAHEGLFHVRCCYNNKYLLAKHHEQASFGFAFAMADEPEEDLSKTSCTLSRIRVEETDTFVEFKKYVRHHLVSFLHPPSEDQKVGFMHKWQNRPYFFYDMILLDLSEQIILPPIVAFKFIKDEKNFYLKQFDEKGLKLASTDIGDKSARFQTFNYANRSVRIKSLGNDKFLNLNYNEDRVVPDETIIDNSALFKALKIGDFFALKILSARKKEIGAASFVSVLWDDWIAAGEASITEQAKFRMEEAVISREIYNVQYHPHHNSRVYDTQNMSLATATAINRTSKENTVKSSVSITTKQSTKWEATATHKASVELTFTAGFSLKVVDLSIQGKFGYEFSHSESWGSEEGTDKNQQIEYEVTVPSNKKVTLTVTAMQAKYDVPFSYTQKDKLHDGTTRIENYDDGLYSGMNCFDLHYETREEEIKIPSKEEKNTEISSKE